MCIDQTITVAEDGGEFSFYFGRICFKILRYTLPPLHKY